MGTVKQAVEAFGTYGGEPRPRAVQIARVLQLDGMLPIKEGKGLRHIGATQLATLFLALATTAKPADATRTALTWGQMTPGGKKLDMRDWDDPNRTRFLLIEVLTGCIGMVWKEAGRGPLTDTVVQSAWEITTTRPHAVVTLDGKRTEYLPLGSAPELAEFPGFHRGDTIRRIAMALHEGANHAAILARQPDANRNPYREPETVLAFPPVR
jgi:hypothetical protein